jgi:hypothetical protein
MPSILKVFKHIALKSLANTLLTKLYAEFLILVHNFALKPSCTIVSRF